MKADMIPYIFSLLSGLALFLFGMKYMSENLQQAAGQKLRSVLDKCTKNRFIGILVGTVFTAFIQSSGATTVMEVGFVNSGLLTLEKSVGLTLGANIGTSITSQLVSLKLTAIAPIIIFVGAAIITFVKRPLVKRIAAIVFGFGALFLGISLMTDSLQTLAQYEVVQNAASVMSNPILAVLIGLVITSLVQSSSVTVSTLVLLADITVVTNGKEHQLLTHTTCLFFIIGAYVGACTPAVIASLHANRNAKRTAFVYLMFNVVGLAVLGVILAFFGKEIIGFIESISHGHKRFVANADTIFKLIICVVGLFVANPLIALSKKVIHKRKSADDEDEEERTLKYIDESGTAVPATAIVEIVSEIERMSKKVRRNFVGSMEALLNNDRKKSEEILEREEYIDYLSHKITEYMVKANRYDLPIADRNRLGGLFHVVIDIERIGDYAVNFINDAWKEEKKNITFSEEGTKEIKHMYTSVLELYDNCIEVFLTMDNTRFAELEDKEAAIDKMEIDYQEHHVKRMAEEKCSIESGLIFTDLVVGLERVGDHSMNIAYSILPEKKDL